jgi:hypothetical protein
MQFDFIVLVEVQEEAPKGSENGHQTDEAAPEGIIYYGVKFSCEM